jgi:hypothetical protein
MDCREFFKGKKITMMGLGISETYGFPTLAPLTAFLHGEQACSPTPSAARVINAHISI